jgi:hypothetical protein
VYNSTHRASVAVAAALTPHAHALHSLLQRLPRVCLQLAERYAAVLVVRRHLLPLFHLWHARRRNCCLCVGDCLAGRHVADLDEGHGDQARPAETRDGLCDEPLGVGLRDDDDCLALLGLQLVGPLRLEVVDDNPVNHCAVLPGARHAHLLRHDVLRGGLRARDALLVARVVWLLLLLLLLLLPLWGGGARRRATTIAHCLAHALKVRHRHQPACAVQRIARLVPVCVVFAPDDVQEIAL